MAEVQTVTGTIDSSELGRTLVHEHIFVLSEEMRQNYDTTWDDEEKIADAVAKLNDLKDAGIDTIFDPTVVGLGRYIPRVQRVAEQTDLNIVAATGLYTFTDLPHQFEHRGPGLLIDEPEPLVKLFVRDLEEGIADTGVKAAFLKCAIESPGLTEGVERTMRAVGQASAQTGAPITVHTNPRTGSGLVTQRVLREEGAELEKVVIGHSGDSTDLDYLSQIAENGSSWAWIGSASTPICRPNHASTPSLNLSAAVMPNASPWPTMRRATSTTSLRRRKRRSNPTGISATSATTSFRCCWTRACPKTTSTPCW